MQSKEPDAEEQNQPSTPHLGESSALRIIQLTDSHLYADPEQRLGGINTQQSFTDTLRVAQSHFKKTDLILATGDLVHDASETGYSRLGSQLSETNIPTYCLAGNHDDASAMEKAMTQENISLAKTVVRGNWQIILLDTTLPGTPAGHLCDKELEILDTALKSNTDHYTLICLHHPPVALGSRWIDQISLDNPSDLFLILDLYPNVKGVIWGHAHQSFDSIRNGVKLMGTPSTCIQFTPTLDDFSLHGLAPGYRWLELTANGKINSGIGRTERVPQGLDLHSAGY